MERTEYALVPEWLRCTRSVAGGGSSARHTEISSSMYTTRSRSCRISSEKDSSRLLDRSSSSDSRRISNSNGSAKHPYSSFTRIHREKNRVRDKEKSLSDEIWEDGSSNRLASILNSGVERSGFKRSQSLVSRKPGEVFPRRTEDTKNSISRQSSNDVLFGGTNPSGIQKSAFEKGFPSLGTEEKQDMTGTRRVLSSGLSSAVQSLPIGNSGFIGSEKWTSALAEVPAVIANNGTCHSPSQQNGVTFATSTSGASCGAGLNMAEALSQPQARVRIALEISDKSQRFEELAIKQSRQLIPMTPSMPKPSGLSSGDKSKQPKSTVRTTEMVVASSKAVQPPPHSPQFSNQSRSGQVRSDSSSTSHNGKFLVLKPGRENTVSIVAKDASISSGDANCRVLNGQLVAPSTPTALSLNGSMATAFPLSSKSTTDKRSSHSALARSRSEFFNLMRKKTTANDVTVLSNPSLAVKEDHAPKSPRALENGNQMVCNGNGDYISEKSNNFSDAGQTNMFCNGQICPDEEEAAFLRSLGWEENSGEDEGLTEEEISAFYQEYMNRRPSLEVCGSSLDTV
ncbi:hypothetical protein ACP275_14G328700 [Erythranthe tilingii]